MESPGSVRVTKMSAELAGRAWVLAQASREDEAAVAELRRLADGHDRDLTLARRRWQVDGLHLEQRDHCRAVRLLRAAAGPARARVQPEPAELSDLFDAVDHLLSQSSGDAFKTLAALEPRLTDVEETVLSGPPSLEPTKGDPVAEPTTEVAHRRIRAGLKPYVGHEAESSTHPLLRTQVAYRTAAGHLTQRPDGLPG